MKRVLVSVLALALLATGLGTLGFAILQLDDEPGVSSVPAAPPTTTPDPEATRPPRADLARFYSQRLDWSSCDDNLCATLEVPLDYRHPEGQALDLAVLKVPAQEPSRRIGSLVVNPGGPGAPGTQYAAQAGQVFRQPLLDRFDIVGFDPRGTGASDPVDCLSDDQLDAYVAMDPDPDTAAERATYLGFVDTLGRGCAERSGDLAAHVSTVEAARDMDVLRAALGESTMTYFGASYGTKLGATYADLFPDRAGRLVLDGAVDLSIGARELALEQAAGFETALRAYVQNCVDQTDSCFLGDSVDAGLARISSFLDGVDAQPLPTSGNRELEVGNAFYGIVAPLYNRDYWYVLSAALKQGFAGDGSTLLQLSDLYSSRGSDGYDDNSAEAIYAISCLDDPYAITGDQVAGQLADFERASPTFGDVFAWGLTGCGGVQARSSEKPRQVRAAGAPPILVIGTTRDPATPMQWAEHLAAQLDSGVLVRRDGDGHTGYNAGNDCVDGAVEHYLLDGTVPQDGLSC
ncbi:alpha/beta hydrolase [Nocardioides sp. MAHUQ-72]|uniref:alpha/beta hydrolase n=1 Tax=unclassified Nocardioides TaxID=2615069 RepID=UPI0036147628